MFDFKFLSERINYNGKLIQTYEYGSGDKYILALPSFPNTGLYYLFVTKYYPKGNYKILSFDIPGWMGWSEDIWENDKFDSDKIVEIAEAVLEAKKIKKFSLLGYSLSSSYAIRLAGRNKDRIHKIVIMSPILYTDLLKGERALKLVNLAQKFKASWALKWYLMRTINRYREGVKNNLDSTIFDLYASSKSHVTPRILRDSLYQAFVTDYSSVVKELESIKNKIMVVNFRLEPSLFKKQAHKLASELGNNKLEVEGGHHEDFVLHPSEEKAKQVFDFLMDY